jgi:hypothetical protein
MGARAGRLTADERRRLDHGAAIVLKLSFNDLLRYVYDRYPDSARRSVANLQ